jgi:precorrin-6B methylase 2
MSILHGSCGLNEIYEIIKTRLVMTGRIVANEAILLTANKAKNDYLMAPRLLRFSGDI